MGLIVLSLVERLSLGSLIRGSTVLVIKEKSEEPLPVSGAVFPDDIIDILNTEPLMIISVANQSKHLHVHHHGNRHQIIQIIGYMY